MLERYKSINKAFLTSNCCFWLKNLIWETTGDGLFHWSKRYYSLWTHILAKVKLQRQSLDCLWIIVMFLSAVWTLILTAPIHCRASIAEQVMQWWRNELFYILDGLRLSTFQQMLISVWTIPLRSQPKEGLLTGGKYFNIQNMTRIIRAWGKDRSNTSPVNRIFRHISDVISRVLLREDREWFKAKLS